MVIETKKRFRFEEVAEMPLPRFPDAEPIEYRKPTVKEVGKQIFKAPIGLGKNIAELYPDVKYARTEVERLRAKGGEYVNIADKMEDLIGQYPTKSKVIGNAIGTAMWLAPAPLAKTLKSAPLLRSFVSGGFFGASYGFADALAEGKTIEQSLVRGIKGGVIGAPLGAISGVVLQHGLKIPKNLAGWVKDKTPEGIKGAINTILSPTMNRIKALGKQGEIIVEKFQKAGIEAKIKMADATAKMGRVGLVQLKKLFPWQKTTPVLSAEQAWRGENSVLDVLMGTASSKVASKEVRAAAKVARKILDEVRESADDVGVLIGRRQNYVSHLVPSADKMALSRVEERALSTAKTVAEREAIYLQSHLKESVRRDVIENAVHKLKKFKTIEEAGGVLNSWSYFVQGGGRIDKKIKPMIEYFIKTGQATSVGQAQSLALKQFVERDLSKLPKFGPLEYPRLLDFPFWDPDPRRFLPTYTFGAIARIETAGQFGVGGQVMADLLKELKVSGGLNTYKLANKLVRTVTGQIERSPVNTKASFFLRSLQVPKLAYAQIVNLGQSLNTLLASDLGSLSYGLQSAFKNKGIQNALESGAILNSVINQQLSYMGGTNFANNLLKYTGFTWTEMFNRTVAANAGMKYAEITLNKLKRNPTNKVLMWRLQELGINPVEALKKGSLIKGDLLKAGNLFTAKTQFLSEPLNLPAWASSPEGKIVFQFKNYAYNQALLVKDQLFNKSIPLSRKFRTLAILGIAFPMTGEVLGDVRSLITGAKRPTKAWDRYWSNIAMAGTFGLALDFWESAKYRSVASSIGGPTIGSIADLSAGFVASIEKGEVTTGFQKSALRQFGLSPISNRLFPTRRKNMGEALDFWDNL